MEIIFIIVTIIIVLVIIECIREVRTFRVTQYQISSSKLKGIQSRRIVLLSDLHGYNYGNQNDKLLDAIRAQHPDLILVAGDMLVGSKRKSPQVAEDFMKELPKICPVYYANGNHEQRLKALPEVEGTDYEAYKTALQEAGVHVLENETTCIAWEEVSIALHGLEIPNECYGKFQKEELPATYLEEKFGVIEPNKYHILIAHNPLYMDAYLKWGADLVVSGHLHGGLARIPFWRGVITPQFTLFPKYSGEHRTVGDTSVVVSKGIGIHTIKIRFLNPAEIVVLHVGNSEE